MINRVFTAQGNSDGDYGRVANVVYETDDLSIFKFSKFNRNVFFKKQMLEQAHEGFIAPVIVNEDMVVIDGQNRLHHAKMAEVPIKYMVVEGLGRHDITRMNTVQKPWTTKNFIEAFANQGNEEYVKLFNLIQEKHNNTTVVSSIGLNDVGTTYTDIIKSGEYKFYNYEKAVEFLGYMERFRDATEIPYKTNITLAIYKLFQLEKFDRERLIQKVLETSTDKRLSVGTLNLTTALIELLDAYNKHATKNSNLFIDYNINSSGNIILNAEKADWAKSTK